jgi:hypothetical protein
MIVKIYPLSESLEAVAQAEKAGARKILLRP